MDSFKSKWIHGSPVFSLIKRFISLTALSRTYSDLLHSTCCVGGNHRDREAQERLNLIKIQHLWEKIKRNHTLYARERHFWHISPVLQPTNPSAESTWRVMLQVQAAACPPPPFFSPVCPFLYDCVTDQTLLRCVSVLMGPAIGQMSYSLWHRGEKHRQISVEFKRSEIKNQESRWTCRQSAAGKLPKRWLELTSGLPCLCVDLAPSVQGSR